MKKNNTHSIYSGASPDRVAEDLKPLVEFQGQGLSIDALQSLIEERLVPHLMNYGKPEFQSMFNAFPEEGARLGAEIALAYNQGVTNWQVSPGGAMLEELCCQALCRLFGLAPAAEATFMYCGTYANQQALYMALHSYAEKKGFDFGLKGLQGFTEPGRLILLTSQDAHFSLRHGVRILGLGDSSLVPVPVDRNRRLEVSSLERQIKELKNSKEIFCIVATAGTTSTGSVDPIDDIATICKDLGIWLHVDGAYGLAYSFVPEWKPLFSGLDRADSVSWDPHKQMRVPIPSSLLFVRNKENFHRLTIHSDYFNREEDPFPNPGLKSPPTTRPLTALALAASLKHQGMDRVIRQLRSPLQTMKEVAELLEGEPDIELGHKPDTGILCLRLRPDGVPERQLDDLQVFIYGKILAEGSRTVSLTRFGNRTYLRFVAVSPLVTVEAVMETLFIARNMAKDFAGN